MGDDFSLEGYRFVSSLGFGMHGVVVKAIESKSGRSVAIKRMDTDSLKRIVREVRILRRLGTHPNILRLADVVVSKEHVYLVTELMSTDLDRVLGISANDEKFQLRSEQCQYLLYQLLCGINFLASACVLHRDLKPSNLLVELKTCQLRICDFGLARTESKCCDDDLEDGTMMTQYVVTRHYRAPELLLGAKYGPPVDVWSAGCIFAQMLAPRMGVLFPGAERRSMLAIVTHLVGRPEKGLERFVTDPHALTFLDSLPATPTRNLRDHLSDWEPQTSKASLDLLEDLLLFDPSRRLTAKKALDHPYLAWARARIGSSGAIALERPARRPVLMDDVEDCNKSIRRILLDEVAILHRRTHGSTE